MAPRKSETKNDEPKFPQIKLITPPMRMSYPKIFDPDQNEQGKDVWEIDALVPPDLKFAKNDKQHDGRFADKFFDDVLLDCLDEVMEKHFGPEDEWPRGRNDYEPKDKIKYLNPKKLPGPGVDEKWQTFKARSYAPVGIVDADKNDVMNKREAYGGRWCRLSLTITVYDQSKSKGPAIYLNNVQLLDNDESFGGRASAEQDFDEYDGPSQGKESTRGRDRDDRRGDRDRGRDDDRSRDRDRGGSDREERGSRGRDRDDDRRDSRRDDERDSGRSRRDDDRGGRDRDEDRGSRSSRDDRSRGRGRDDEASDDRGSRGRDRGEDRSRGRDDGERRDRSSSRASEKSEGRGRDRDDDRGRDREDDRSGRGRDRGREKDEDQADERRPSRDTGSRGSGRSRDEAEDDEWN